VREQRRPSSRQRGYGTRWQRESKAYLLLHPWCSCGCGARAQMVDHKRPHRGDAVLFWDRANWQGLAWSCHSRKTAAEDGGFGNPRHRE
jgi:5-methylcytosine-specific restriction protein A